MAELKVEKVLTLDHSNFSDTVAKHEFIVVKFYVPGSVHCNFRALEYEKAASELSSHEPSIVLAKVDANEEANRELVSQFEIWSEPSIKILRNGGKNIQDYKGTWEADGIVEYLKKQAVPASAEIKSTEDASSLIDEKKVSVIGVFPKFSGQEFENFMKLAEKLRPDYDFRHTLDAKLVPRGGPVNKATIRLLKPFDELFLDFQDFEVDEMEKFVEEANVPIVTVWNSDPNNQPYIDKFFASSNNKVMLYVNFGTDHDLFQPKYKNAATLFKGNGISFLLGDIEGSFQGFGIEVEQGLRAPLILVLGSEGKKYLKANIKPAQIESWLKDYMNGLVKPFLRSEPIPESNGEPVKVVVANSLQDMVFNSGKNVFLMFYLPWCRPCKNLAPILEEVAISFENDPGVLIAKFNTTTNDVPRETFDVKGYPTIYFRSSSGSLVTYHGNRTKEDIIEFIQENRDRITESTGFFGEKFKLTIPSGQSPV